MQSVKLVNNLKVAANRRAVVNGLVTITPYDARFPRAAVWGVQMVQDAAILVARCIAVAALAGTFVLLHAEIGGEFLGGNFGGARNNC